MDNAARRLAPLVAAALIMSSCAATPGEAALPSVGSTTSGQSGVQASLAPSASATAAATGPLQHPEGTIVQVGEPWIAYQWVQADGDGIYLVRPDGTDPHALLPDAKYNAFHPDWSPNGKQIAFDAETGGGNEIWVVNADGTNAAVIVPRRTECAISCGDVALPAWSPDGSKIAFVRFCSARAVVWRRP